MAAILKVFCSACLAPVPAGAPRCKHCGAARPSAGWLPDRYMGRLLNEQYRIAARLGAGGYGVVYLARQVKGDIDLGEVVLKFLRGTIAVQEDERRRFIYEARAIRMVHSPHVVKIFDLDFDTDGTPFLVMEYLKGESLGTLLRREQRLAPQRALRLGLQVASALAACHAAGIVHRDLKPGNLLLLDGSRGGSSGDFVKLLDFGIARSLEREDSSSTRVGTPRYMAPEQLLRRPIDQRADLFPLGVILYEALTGRPPIEGQAERAVLHTVPAPLRQHCPELPQELERLLAAMMAKDPSDRPASAQRVERELQTIGTLMGWSAERDVMQLDAMQRPAGAEAALLDDAPTIALGPPAAAPGLPTQTRADTPPAGRPREDARASDLAHSAPRAEKPRAARPRRLGQSLGLFAGVVVLAGVGLLLWLLASAPGADTGLAAGAPDAALPRRPDGAARRLDRGAPSRRPDAAPADRAAGSPHDARAPATPDLARRSGKRRPRKRRRPPGPVFRRVPGGL